jgi:hypothetical protein
MDPRHRLEAKRPNPIRPIETVSHFPSDRMQATIVRTAKLAARRNPHLGPSTVYVNAQVSGYCLSACLRAVR